MKWISSTLCLFLAAIVASCAKTGNEEPTPTPTPTPEPTPADQIELTGDCSSGRLTFSSDGAVAKLSFKSSGDWTVMVPSATASWCSVEPLTGTAGDASPTVTIRANDTYDERNASLTIATGKASKTLVLAQKQLDALLLSSSKIEVGEAGETFSITAQANVIVNYEIPAQYAWIHAGGSRGLTESKFTFTADANDTEDTRQAQIIFRGGEMEETVNVYQAVYNGIILSETTKHIGADGGTFAVELKSNIDFTYKIDEGCTWLHEDQTRAYSSHTLYFTADPYDNPNENRSTTVTFTPPLDIMLIVKYLA